MFLKQVKELRDPIPSFKYESTSSDSQQSPFFLNSLKITVF